jgi:hypothetical protein
VTPRSPQGRLHDMVAKHQLTPPAGPEPATGRVRSGCRDDLVSFKTGQPAVSQLLQCVLGL